MWANLEKMNHSHCLLRQWTQHEIQRWVATGKCHFQDISSLFPRIFLISLEFIPIHEKTVNSLLWSINTPFLTEMPKIARNTNIGDIDLKFITKQVLVLFSMSKSVLETINFYEFERIKLNRVGRPHSPLCPIWRYIFKESYRERESFFFNLIQFNSIQWL